MSQAVIEQDQSLETESPGLPNEWEWKTIEEIAQTSSGGTPSSKNQSFYGGSIPWLRITDLNDSYIKESERSITEAGFAGSAAKWIDPGAVLVAMYGASIGKLGRLAIKATTNQAICALQPKDVVSSDYLYWFLRHERPKFWTKARGGAQLNISQGDLKTWPIPVPPKEQQAVIVRQIEGRFAEIASIENALDETEVLQGQLLQALLRDAFAGRLSGHHDLPGAEVLDNEGRLALPAGWEWRTAESLAKDAPHALSIGPFGSNLKVSDYQPEGVPLVFVAEIRSQEFGGPETKFVSPSKALELASHRVLPGDLLITKMGDPPGDAATYPEGLPEGIITSDCIRFAVDEKKALPSFIELSFGSHLLKKQVLEATRGVAQRKMSLGRFRKIEFPVPPLSDQREILRRLDAEMSKQKEISASIQGSRSMLSDLRRAVLNQAFTGQFVNLHIKPRSSREATGETA